MPKSPVIMALRLRSILCVAFTVGVFSSCAKRSGQSSDAVASPLSKFDRKPKDDRREIVRPAEENGWFLKNPELDQLEGASVNRAYAELGLGSGQTIVVAVIDTGVDITHEDLQGKIWTNAGEIPANGIDDDKNGFIDDVHGWNFLGRVYPDGKYQNLISERLESTRELARLKKKKAELGRALSAADDAALNKLKSYVAKERKDASATIVDTNGQLASLKKNFDTLRPVLGEMKFDDLTLDSLASLHTEDPAMKAAVAILFRLFKEDETEDVALLKRRIVNAQLSLDQYFNEDFDTRQSIIGDNVEDYSDHKYGNPDVIGPYSAHGTHVAGIIGAIRGNGIGIDGVASNVRIMSVRAIPDGDERDKDIANAIRYAVDNGARVINMSFNKTTSPGKEAVDQAILYAETKNVLLVNAAGNENADVEQIRNFPTRYVLSRPNQPVTGWLTVGASAQSRTELLPAEFSNYGRHDVDFFAPGEKIRSTAPGNAYAVLSGTSQAAPIASGIAALILSQKPELTAENVAALLRASTRSYPSLIVRLPGSDPIQRVLFSHLSRTGGIIDAFRALKQAFMSPLLDLPLKQTASPTAPLKP